MLLCLFVTACHDKNKQQNANAQTAIATLQTPVTQLFYSATIAPIRSQAVFSPIDARINKIMFKYGETVKKNQPLVVLSSTELIDNYRKAVSDYLQNKEAYENGKTSFQGTQVLYKAEIISKEDFENERASLEAKALSANQSSYELEKLLNKAGIPADDIEKLQLVDINTVTQILNKQFGEVQIKSPADGVALFPISQDQKSDDKGGKLQEGDEVKADQLVLSIGDLSGFSVKFDVSEININQIRMNLPATVTGDAFPGIVLHGLVTAVTSQAKPSGGDDSSGGNLGMFDVEVQVPKISSKERAVIHIGMSAKVELDIPGEKQILLPVNTVFIKNNQTMVTKIDAQGQQQDVAVVTGPTTLTDVSIVSGVAPGDKVLIQPSSVNTLGSSSSSDAANSDDSDD